MYPRIPPELVVVHTGSVEHALVTTVLMYIFVIKSVVKKDEFMRMCTHVGVRTHTRK
jgi:hypothetical protein